MAYATEIRIPGAALIERTGTLMSSLADRFAKHQLFRTTVRELGALSDRELADLGIHRSAIKRIALDSAYGA